MENQIYIKRMWSFSGARSPVFNNELSICSIYLWKALVKACTVQLPAILKEPIMRICESLRYWRLIRDPLKISSLFLCLSTISAIKFLPFLSSHWLSSSFFCLNPFNLLTERSFFEPMQISSGTQWNVVSIGCTSCIKINFTDGEVFWGIHYYNFDVLK